MAGRIMVRGQVHEVRDAVVDHLTRRGEIAELRLVRSHCATCGEPFIQWRTASAGPAPFFYATQIIGLARFEALD